MNDLISKDQVFIDKLTEIIEANLRNENFGVKELAKISGLSRYTLNRKLNAIIGKPVNQFIRETKLRKALEMLKKGGVSASDVAYSTGFSSPAYFNKCFHDFYGFSPGKVKTGEAEIKEKKLPRPIRRSVIYTLSGILSIGALAVIVISLLYPDIYRRSDLGEFLASGKKITVAVMPFRNLSHDTMRLGEAVQVSLISFLSGFPEELKVEQEESINGILASSGLTNYSTITPSMALSAARKLDANIFISGDIIKSGNKSRFFTVLTDSKTKEVIKSFTNDCLSIEENLFQILNSINSQVADYFQISRLEKKNMEFAKVTTTSSAEAYTFYLNGKDAYYNMEYTDAIDCFKRALAADTNFIWVMKFLVMSYQNIGDDEETRKWALRLYSRKDMMNNYQKLYADYAYSNTFQTPHESIKTLKLLLKINDQPSIHRSLGAKYVNLQQYEMAIPELEKVLEIYKKWGSKPLDYSFYSFLGVSYHETGQYRKEEKLYKKAERDFPENIYITGRQAILALTEEDTVRANRFIKKFRSILKGNSVPEANIIGNMGSLYRDARLPDIAEEYYQRAIQLAPANVGWQNALAFLLIDTRKDINEGMDLVENILRANSANLGALRTKGWGLYKQGKSREALEILEKSWDTKLYGYDHAAFLQLDEVKKAVAELPVRLILLCARVVFN
ncbi:MAG: helix-turn-helix domain-containing protein [Bacteroidia bacterium]|nr:helix-turn-helix domain-containing protein [Bacteroidia bacterium]